MIIVFWIIATRIIATIGVLSGAGAFVLALAMAKAAGQEPPSPQKRMEQES
jgi:hypothetical protein